MPQLAAYLSYDGNCAEAMRFYAKVLGAKVQTLITYGQAPMGDQPGPPEHAHRIMHAHLVHKDFSLMAGDAPPGVPYQGGAGRAHRRSADDEGDRRPATAASASSSRWRWRASRSKAGPVGTRRASARR
jgi:PhnB protein